MKPLALPARPTTLSILALALVAACCRPSVAAETKPDAQPRARNVIVLIVDGCGAEAYTLARWFQGGPLAADAIRTGAVKTFIADSVVADSAPAGSAYATGVRTCDNFISVGPKKETLSVLPTPPEELRYRPLATVLEGARLLGKSTGIVVTCRVTHATPAAFMAHVPDRQEENDIMEQVVHQNVDVVFGGGLGHLLPKSAGGKRADGKNLAGVLTRRGYRIVKTRQELAACDRARVFGLFAASHMAAEIDRQEFAPSEPTLEEMTRKAVELLSKNPKGFFLMVEGSQVDWAAHANDPAHLLSDLLMFDRAVAAALEFARQDGHTLVIVTSDHSTGGLSIGNYATSKTYSQMKLEDLLGPLRNMKLSAPAMWKKLGDDKTPENVRRVVKRYWGLEITGDDARQILAVAEKEKGSPHNAFGRVLCATHTVLGWSSHGHTGGDVPLGAFGPGRPVGLLDGPEIGRLTAAALGLDLRQLNRRLFVEPAEALPGAKVSLDTHEEHNPVVRIEAAGKTARLPVNKNLLLLDGRTIELEGVVVYAPDTKKIYVPVQAVRIIAGTDAPLPAVAR